MQPYRHCQSEVASDQNLFQILNLAVERREYRHQIGGDTGLIRAPEADQQRLVIGWPVARVRGHRRQGYGGSTCDVDTSPVAVPTVTLDRVPAACWCPRRSVDEGAEIPRPVDRHIGSMAIRVGVLGAGGRMGSEVCAAVAGDPDLELVAAVDPFYRGLDLQTVTKVDSPIKSRGESVAFERTNAQVVVDFSQRAASVGNLVWLAEHGIHGGWDDGLHDEELDRFRGAFTKSNCLIAPNFAIGAVLMMHFRGQGGAVLRIGRGHRTASREQDRRPSGTAMLVQRMAEASGEWTADPTEHEVVEVRTGGTGPPGIHVHSLRVKGLVAHRR